MALRVRQRPAIPPRYAVEVLDRVIDAALSASMNPHKRTALTRANLIESLAIPEDEKSDFEKDLDDLEARGWVVPVSETMHITSDGFLASKHREQVQAALDHLSAGKLAVPALSGLAVLCRLPGYINGVESLGGSPTFAVTSAEAMLRTS